MANMRPGLLGVLAVLGLLSIILQAVGLFSPTWMIYSMKIDMDKLENSSMSGAVGNQAQDMDLDVEMGLWSLRVCVKTQDELSQQCRTVSTSDLLEMISSGGSSMNQAAFDRQMSGWRVLQILAIFALICAISGLTCLVILAKASVNTIRRNGCLTAFCWLLSAILILAAVGKRAAEDSVYGLGSDVVNQMDMGVSLHLQTPWAIILSGIGGGIGAVISLATVAYLVFRGKATQRWDSDHDVKLLGSDDE